MKLTKETLSKIIKEEMEAITGSGYKSAAGNVFNKFGGTASVESLLEDATGALYQIKSVKRVLISWVKASCKANRRTIPT